MRSNKSVPVVFAVVLVICQARAQPKADDERLQHLQFSISVSNTNIASGSTNGIKCQITNGLAEVIRVHQPVWEGTALSLVDKSGKIHWLTQEPDQDIFDSMGRYFGSLPVDPGKIYVWQITLTFTNLGVGKYRVTTRSVSSTFGKSFHIDSKTTEPWEWQSTLALADLDPGEYQLTATRAVLTYAPTNGIKGRIKSNPVTVRIQ